MFGSTLGALDREHVEGSDREDIEGHEDIDAVEDAKGDDNCRVDQVAIEGNYVKCGPPIKVAVDEERQREASSFIKQEQIIHVEFFLLLLT